MLVTLGLAMAPAAGAITLDFEQFVHGEVISGTTVQGVTITAFNPHKPFDYGAVFDTNVTGSRDPDLEIGDGWRGGNLAPSNENLGNILIVQRFGTDCETGICKTPDDDGTPPGGTMLDFVFEQDITSIGWDLVDIDDSETGGFITIFSGQQEMSFEFGELLAADLFGDGTANRFDPILASELGFQFIDRVKITFGGSGGIDNLQFEPVPEPGTIALLGAGLIGIGSIGRRRRR